MNRVNSQDCKSDECGWAHSAIDTSPLQHKVFDSPPMRAGDRIDDRDRPDQSGERIQPGAMIFAIRLSRPQDPKRAAIRNHEAQRGFESTAYVVQAGRPIPARCPMIRRTASRRFQIQATNEVVPIGGRPHPAATAAAPGRPWRFPALASRSPAPRIIEPGGSRFRLAWPGRSWPALQRRQFIDHYA